MLSVENYYPVSQQVIQAENNAIDPINNGITPIRSQWRYMAHNSIFPMIIFHASQDGIVSQQYQTDMNIVLPSQWPITYVTYYGSNNLPQDAATTSSVNHN